jgi:hypothetical protein
MHPDDFNGNHDRRNTSNNTAELPSSIDTLDDAIAYLQRARATMGGNTKFRLVADGNEHDEDYYGPVGNVILTGNNSLMLKSHRRENNEYVLFCY